VTELTSIKLTPHTSTDWTVAAVIPHIPPRKWELKRALGSVANQTRPPEQVIVHTDVEGTGAAMARNHALDQVTCDWVAFLDDDDEWLPHHLETLIARARETSACLVYPLLQGLNVDLFYKTLEVPFSDYHYLLLHGQANYIPITVLARLTCLRAVGGFNPPPWAHGAGVCEDWGAWVRMLDAGCTFVNCPVVTWEWHAGRHTSGRPWHEVYDDYEERNT